MKDILFKKEKKTEEKEGALKSDAHKETLQWGREFRQ